MKETILQNRTTSQPTPNEPDAADRSPVAGAKASGDSSEFLLYLYSNNSTETPKTDPDLETVQGLASLLSAYHKRAAETLNLNVARLIDQAPSLNHVGFLTLTFPDNVTDHKEAYNRFRSMNTHFLAPSPEFGHWLCVKERQKRGAWHYHLLIVTKGDIRGNIDFDEIEKGRYGSAPQYLRDLWHLLRINLPYYGFGRSELLPIRKNEQAMARYVGKYVSKHMGVRKQEDSGVRLVNYSKGWEKNSVNFQWHTEGAQEWRRKVGVFARVHGCSDMYDLTQKLGQGWAYRWADIIGNIDDYVERANEEVPF